MRIDIISIFPEIFEPTLGSSMLGIARDKGAVTFAIHNLRDWAEGKHRTTDDYPFGGGYGMVMKPEPFFSAVEAVKALDDAPATVVLMCPQGRRLDQKLVEDLSKRERLVILCGRYEGVDERVRSLVDIEVSAGDYVLTGGELPAMILVDAVTRLQPGVLASETSIEEESFSWGLLEYPQYTRPASFRGMDVPEVLLSGDHGRVDRWRRTEAIRRTAQRRPDLLPGADLSSEERSFAEEALGSNAPEGDTL
ncbi:MAG: tRNA (guanosine(37)-N1)-methyltransferase TrmD [Actinobacteria bacterium HGW-Actinobacteria-6]|jgi:tRNA (guanine37-N1)-methyltransferase|nr:MAG: tRNA (guanosine(37)-N1)-methyltransferase TrmD [Actinobacteria bacterium HGW-Actinobacteria-6]